MSFPAAPRSYASETGLERSARLMHALGAAQSSVWKQLTDDEAARLTKAMERHGPDDPESADEIADEFLRAASALPITLPLRAGDVWLRLSALEPAVLAGLIAGEHPQTIAMILSRLTPSSSASLLAALPAPLSMDALRRLLHMGPAIKSASDAVERALGETLGALDLAAPGEGHERVARIFDRLDGRSEQVFLAALESAEPGAGTRVRALMFTFDDLVKLDAAGLQTLIAAADRSTLTLALKGAKQATHAAFFTNITQRAGEVLREEITALGPVRRSDIDAARAEIVALARGMIQHGEINAAGVTDVDELVE